MDPHGDDRPNIVAKVIVGDLAASGALIVHPSGIQDVPDLAFLERILAGLRHL